ncbi:MAG: MltA domain-containing protein [bacterium]
MATRRDDGLERIRARVREAVRTPEPEEHPSENEIAAWLDGAQSEDEAAAFEAHAADCGFCSEVLVSARRAVPLTSAQEVAARWRMAAGILLALGSLLGAVYAGRTTGAKIETVALTKLGTMLGGRINASDTSLVLDKEGPALVIGDLRVRVPAAPPVVAAEQAILRPDLGALVRGELRGRLKLRRPVFTIVRTAEGAFSIDPLLPGPNKARELRDKAWKQSLSRVFFADATVRYLDHGLAGRTVHAAAVEADFTSLAGPGPIGVRIEAGVEAMRRNVSLAGTVDARSTATPRYDFSRVLLTQLPLRVFGNAGDRLLGRLSFEGTLRSEGQRWDQILNQLSGAGSLEIDHGVLLGANLLGQVLREVADARVGTPLPFLLRQKNTKFEHLIATVELDSGALAASDLLVEGEGWQLSGTGRLSAEGHLTGSLRLRLEPALAAELVPAAAQLAARRSADGSFETSLVLSGTWSALQIRTQNETGESSGSAPRASPADASDLERALRRASAALGRGGALPTEVPAALAAIEGGAVSRDALLAGLAPRRHDEILLTGYYEPVLEARRSRDARFRHALLAPPAAGTQRSRSRAEIAAGALDGAGLEMFWVEDSVDLFFLQIQGSGRLRLADGSLVRVGYAASNGREHRSLGRVMIERGLLTREEATAPGIQAWLRAHPDTIDELLATNPRFIFFREVDLPPADGPIGSLGVPLVAWRSVAADPAVTPPGSLGRLRAKLPDGRSIDLLVVAMDSGAAIRGRGRLDLFLGTGDEAFALAGILRAPATIDWLRVP